MRFPLATVHGRRLTSRLLDLPTAMAKVAEHQRTPAVYAEYDGYALRTTYHFLKPGAVKNPIVPAAQAGLDCRIM